MTRADTIFALSSGAPPAGIGVIRISGPAAGEALRVLAGRLPTPRVATLGALRSPGGDLLDRALLLWLPGPGTVTGEDLAELHLHGGRAIIAALTAALGEMPGLRSAQPGEFTRRALEHGRLDLAEAEGLADLLSAETESQRRNALAMAGGALSRQVEGWRERVLAVAAAVEAVLDFSDEDDVEQRGDWPEIALIASEIAAVLDVPPVDRLRDGIRVVIAGPPNAGKSTLLNALIGREAAITSAVPGTTRDVVEAPVSIGGIAFLLSDTAGLRETDDPIERIGVERANAALASADIILWLDDGSPPDDGRALPIFARSDVRPGAVTEGAMRISAVTGEGLDKLKAELIGRAGILLPGENELALNRRQRDALRAAADWLDLALSNADLLLVAEGLRGARVALDAITGRAGVEDVLDALFGRFCIGK